MLKFLKTTLAVALLAAGVSVQAATVTSLTIAGGEFAMNDSSFSNSRVISAGDQGPMVMDSYQGFNDGTADGVNAVATFVFGGFGPVDAYTSGSQVIGGVNGGAPEYPSAPGGTVSGSTISLDLSSWTAFWNGNEFNQGNHNVTGSYDSVSGNYAIEWSSLVSGGPFDGHTGWWRLHGVATVEGAPQVPAPAAIWLFGSGLLGLIGVARRRQVSV